MSVCVLVCRAALAQPAADEDEYTTVVRADPPPTTASERRVDAEQIAVTPHRNTDDLLQLVPGLLISQHGSEGKGHQIFFRGFDAIHGSDVEVLVGGIPVNETSNVHGQGYLDLGFVIPETIRSIEANGGSFFLDQGNFATAGTVRIDLGVPRASRGTRVGYQAGTSDRHRLLLLHAPRDLPESTFVAVEVMHDDGYGENRESERLSVLGQTQVWARGAQRVDVLASAYGARFGEPGVVALADVEARRIGFYDTYRDDTMGDSRRALVGARFSDDGGPGKLSVLAYGQSRGLELSHDFTGYLVDPVRGDRRLQLHETVGGGLRVDWERRLTSGLSLLASADAQVESLEQREDQIDENHEPWRRNRDLTAIPLAGDARLGARWSPTPWLGLEGGSRVDVFHFVATDELESEGTVTDTMAVVSPRVTTSFLVSDEWTLFGAWGRGFRAPEARAITAKGRENEDVDLRQYQGGEPLVTTSDAVETGARWRIPRGPEIGLAAFGTWIAHESVFDHASGVNVELNSTRRLGVELGVSYRPASWLDLRTDATGVDARFVESGNPVPGAPTLLTTAEATVRLPGGTRVGSRFLYVPPRPLAHGATAGTTAVLDLVASHRWRWLEIDVEVDNATDARWKKGEFHYASWFDRSEPRSRIPRIHYAAGPPLTVRAGLTGWF